MTSRLAILHGHAAAGNAIALRLLRTTAAEWRLTPVKQQPQTVTPHARRASGKAADLPGVDLHPARFAC